jgi:hypothetical protein
MNSRYRSKNYRGWSLRHTSPKVSAGYLHYPADIRDTAKSGMGCGDNHHLRYFAESIFVNVGGSRQNVKGSSLPMSVLSVGGSIVVRGRESRPHGEGGQEFNVFPLEINRSQGNPRRILPSAVIRTKSKGTDNHGG